MCQNLEWISRCTHIEILNSIRHARKKKTARHFFFHYGNVLASDINLNLNYNDKVASWLLGNRSMSTQTFPKIYKKVYFLMFIVLKLGQIPYISAHRKMTQSQATNEFPTHDDWCSFLFTFSHWIPVVTLSIYCHACLWLWLFFFCVCKASIYSHDDRPIEWFIYGIRFKTIVIFLGHY